MLSDEKLNHLSHVLIDAATDLAGARFPKDRNRARLRILALLREGVEAEEAVHERVRARIASQKRDVPEGGREWDVLYRRYYEAEMAKINPLASEK